MRCFLFVFLIFISASCRKNQPLSRVFKIAIQPSASSYIINPLKSRNAGDFNIYLALFEGLTSFDPIASSPVAGMAYHWEEYENKHIYRFFLRDTFWSDGEPVKAQDFVFGIESFLKERAKDNFYFLPHRFLLGAEEFMSGDSSLLSGVQALSDKVLQLAFTVAAPNLFESLAHFYFAPLPLHIFERYGNDWEKPEYFVSNGPFMLAEFNTENSLVLVKNPYYWDKNNVFLDRIDVFNYSVEESLYLFSKGKLDSVFDIGAAAPDFAALSSQYITTPLFGSYFYLYNLNNPLLRDASVRKALNLAVNRSALLQAVLPDTGEIPAYSLVPAAAFYPAQRLIGHDAQAAQAFLKSSILANTPKPELRLLIPKESPIDQRIALEVVKHWQNYLNLYVNIEAVSKEEFDLRRAARDYDLILSNQLGSYRSPEAFLDHFISFAHTKQPFGYYNPSFNNLVALAREESDISTRFMLFKEAETKLVVEDAVILPLFFPVLHSVANTEMWRGLDSQAAYWYPWKFIAKKAN